MPGVREWVQAHDGKSGWYDALAPLECENAARSRARVPPSLLTCDVAMVRHCAGAGAYTHPFGLLLSYHRSWVII